MRISHNELSRPLLHRIVRSTATHVLRDDPHGLGRGRPQMVQDSDRELVGLAGREHLIDLR